MKRSLFILTILSIICLPLTGCSLRFGGQRSEASPYKEPIIVDVYDLYSNYQGIQSGWFSQLIKKKFNMELNIITGGQSSFDYRRASGNVGDLIICTTENSQLQSLVAAGLVTDMTKYLVNKDIMNYNIAISNLNDKMPKTGIYAIPADISSRSATTSSEGLDLSFGPYLRWDIYSSIGNPHMSTLEDMLPVLEQMQKAMPYSDSGKPTYAFSFFKDWDNNMMTMAKQPACFYGYDEFGFVLAKADGSDYQNILYTDSIYMRVLKLYYDANQLGLVDPESPVQTAGDVFDKYKDGSILYSPWPWYAQSAYNTLDHKTVGKGYMLAPIDDMKIFSYGCNPYGNTRKVIAIGSGAKDPERLASFIDWMYSPEGVQALGASRGGTAGLKGLTWDMDDKGPYLTDYGIKVLFNQDADVPSQWGSGTWSDGCSQLNFSPVSLTDLDPNGYPYNYMLWKSVLNYEKTTLDLNWSTYMGADSTHQYLQKHNQILVAPGYNYVEPVSSPEIISRRNLCRSIIIDYSWRMVFARNENEFNSLRDQMQRKAKAVGYDSVYTVDLMNAKGMDAARKEAVTLSNQ